METLIVQPKTQKQLQAVKAVLKALDVSFKKTAEESSYNPKFVSKIRESEQNYKDGNFKIIKVEDLWK
ncbi:DUF2683 family protein [Pedobacter endophyticus]|uniref:Uncharacterized protein n=1 Tax=Pedobacter endophyticus TaxID=2789740 RepID=A0A7U3Q4P1_9SPHI|nr:DUF2683 family protein [Pedobacter endophyticus]QPH37687.1 hypothetical protein IZT61_11220 [Pedobacter endophyticus]